MILIRTVTITSGMVTANNAVNADADYNPATTYALDALVSYNLRIYKSLQNANTGNTPGITASAAWWADQGPTNKWAAFDDQVTTQTTRATPLTFTISPVSADSIGLLNLDAAEARVVVTKGAATPYDETISLWDTSVITDWAEYFFNPIEYKPDLALTDLPVAPDTTVSVTLSKTSGNVACGLVVLGRQLAGGEEMFGLKREGIDYSTVTFDQYGASTITRRGYSKKFSSRARIENGKLDMIIKRLDSLASTPLLVVGAEGLYSSMIVYGLMTYSLDLALVRHSYLSYEIKGFI